jgi:hypothetical protein
MLHYSKYNNSTTLNMYHHRNITVRNFISSRDFPCYTSWEPYKMKAKIR